jgi:hypothetical protein
VWPTGSSTAATCLAESPVLVERDHQPVQPPASADASESDRAFLGGFFAGEPDSSLLPYPHAGELPAPAWKLRNLEIFRFKRPVDFDRQHASLVALLT